MLVLTRKRDEAIVIRTRFGTEIHLSVVDIRGNKVRLGIDAPREISVEREEVSERGSGRESFAREMAWI